MKKIIEEHKGLFSQSRSVFCCCWLFHKSFCQTTVSSVYISLPSHYGLNEIN